MSWPQLQTSHYQDFAYADGSKQLVTDPLTMADMAAELIAAAENHIALAAELSYVASQHKRDDVGAQQYGFLTDNLVPDWWTSNNMGYANRSQSFGIHQHQIRKKHLVRGAAAKNNMQSSPVHGKQLAPTTIMFRNLPFEYTRDMLVELLDEEGFGGQYDFVYLPIDFNRCASFGYAFTNFVSHDIARQARAHFEGFHNWSVDSTQICESRWNEPVQGLRGNIERYRNSSVMHENVPEECKPLLFSHGSRIQFPRPTKPIKPPRIRHQRTSLSPGCLPSTPSESSGEDASESRSTVER